MNWDELAVGNACPLDQPRAEPNDFWDSVVRLDVSTLCLLKNQTYRGHCILIYDPRHVVRLEQLTSAEWAKLASDIHRCAIALTAVCRPDHMNVESLGMQMPHLHWQLIPRYKDDPRWGGPIWTTTIEEFHRRTMAEPERQQLIVDLRRQFSQ